jgi:hypothetical protein
MVLAIQFKRCVDTAANRLIARLRTVCEIVVSQAVFAFRVPLDATITVLQAPKTIFAFPSYLSALSRRSASKGILASNP